MAYAYDIPFHVDLSGRVALVTGGNGGIGGMYSRALAACGATVIVLGRNLERCEAVAGEIVSGGGQAVAISADVTDEAAMLRVADEVKARWGETSAYAESQARTGAYGAGDWAAIQAGMDERMAAFAAVRELAPEDARVQALVADWQRYITDHFYSCTDEILEGLGQMYVADERFRQNIDRHGEGTAACMARAIAAYCAARRKDGRPA